MLKLNDVIKDYTVTKEINVGGFCNSYFVNSPSGKYFLKEYSDPKETDEDFEVFFDNQCTIIDRLNSMGSITEKFVDHFVQDGKYYQVKELLKGVDLNDYLMEHVEYWERIQVSIIFCGVLRNLHSNNIVHQDLKPGQVMMVDDEIGKKTKLGYRIILSDFDWSIPDGKVARLVNTPYYASPEHYKGETPIYKSDIFTLGIMIYEFLTGRNPFDFDDDATPEILSERVLNKKIYAEPKNLNEEIAPQINDILIKCLDPNPKNRPEISDIQKTIIENQEPIKVELKETAPSDLPEEIKPELKEVTEVISKELVKNKFTISNGTNKLIVYGEKTIGRSEFKLFFRDLIDQSGNEIYKYCDNEKPMLKVTTNEDKTFNIEHVEETKNKFLLNDNPLETKTLLEKNTKLQLFSTGKSEIVAEFIIS